MGGIPRSYEYMKIRVRLMRTREDVNENRGVFRSRRGAARSAPARWGKVGTLNACKEILEGLRGRRINAFRLRGFGHVREYTPVALLHKAAFLRATSQASTARQPPRGRLEENAIFGTFAMSEISRFLYITW